jgi:alcohol dehydrogenase, propanol-preferring
MFGNLRVRNQTADSVPPSIGLPPAGKYHIDLDPSQLVFRNQSVQGTLVASLQDIDETLEFAARGKLRLEPTVVGRSKFNESVQKLKNGQVAGVSHAQRAPQLC